VTTIRNAKTKADLISAINEENQTNTIRRRFNALGETFEATIISNWEEDEESLKGIMDQHGRSWYLVRVLAKDESDGMRLSPYENLLSKAEIYRRINDHRQAQLFKATDDIKAPVHGTIWRCRYAGKNYMPPIILEQYLRTGDGDAKVTAMKKANGWIKDKSQADKTKPAVKTVAEIKAEALPDIIPGEYTPISNFRGRNAQDISFQQGKCKNQSYPNLPKKDGIFYKYDKATVIRAIKNSGQSTSVQRIMYGIIKHEQGKLHFPGNNVAGIQLDFGSSRDPFRGATEGDFDYQFCLQDNGGDWRIFAGFNDLGRGMKVFGVIIAKKRFKALAGSVDQQAETMTENYYSNWNTKFNATEIESLKKTDQVTRNGKTYVRHWAPSKKVFVKAFQEFGVK
jgi:hypothetical protein